MPLVVGPFSGLMLVLLEISSNDTEVCSSLITQPFKWVPEYVIWGMAAVYLLVGIVFGSRVTSATDVHAFRAAASLLVTLLVFGIAFRLLEAALGANGLLTVAGAVSLSIVALVSVVFTTRERMIRTREQGLFDKYLQTDDWTWHLPEPFDPRIDPGDDLVRSLASKLSKLH